MAGQLRAQAIRVAIDTLGADAPAAELVCGALAALGAVRQDFAADVALTFYGDGDAIAPLIGGRHRVVHAPRTLSVDDSLRATLRGKVRSSMQTAICALACGGHDALVTAGSTGALMALCRHAVGMLPGYRRPAIIKALVGEGGHVFRVLDLGANIGVGAPALHQFARMGVAAALAGGVAEPTVALLNIGSEVRKGPPVVRAAARLLEADRQLRYVGYIEPDRLFAAGVDVVVADGFAGNIALKATEGAVRMARYLLARELDAASPALESAKTQLREPLEQLREAYNPQSYNGAILLGLKRVVVKSHGGADSQGFAGAVGQAVQALSADLIAKVAAASTHSSKETA